LRHTAQRPDFSLPNVEELNFAEAARERETFQQLAPTLLACSSDSNLALTLRSLQGDAASNRNRLIETLASQLSRTLSGDSTTIPILRFFSHQIVSFVCCSMQSD